MADKITLLGSLSWIQQYEAYDEPLDQWKYSSIVGPFYTGIVKYYDEQNDEWHIEWTRSDNPRISNR